MSRVHRRVPRPPRQTAPEVPDTYFPFIMREAVPYLLTRAECDAYFADRGTVIVKTDMPATCPREEVGDSPEKHALSLERTRRGLVTQKVLR